MTKAVFGLLAAVFIAIAAAKFAYSVSSDVGDEPIQEAWAQDKMEFVSWNNQQWTAWIHEGVFKQVPQDSARWSRHTNASIAFINWDGEPWQAKIDGETFLLAHHGDWQEPAVQSEAIRYRDWDGNNQLRTVAEIQR
jgi:hypothetical protein